jgi:hypothetical protein
MKRKEKKRKEKKRKEKKRKEKIGLCLDIFTHAFSTHHSPPSFFFNIKKEKRKMIALLPRGQVGFNLGTFSLDASCSWDGGPRASASTRPILCIDCAAL